MIGIDKNLSIYLVNYAKNTKKSRQHKKYTSHGKIHKFNLQNIPFHKKNP